jgi:hypothetical protein
MKLRLRDILDSVDESDLAKMQADLAKGGVFLRKLVDDKVQQLEHQKRGSCVTCGQNLEQKYKTYTLIFGPDDFRKKASFCEIDCLEYFMASLKRAGEQVKEGGTDDL